MELWYVPVLVLILIGGLFVLVGYLGGRNPSTPEKESICPKCGEKSVIETTETLPDTEVRSGWQSETKVRLCQNCDYKVDLEPTRTYFNCGNR